MSGQSSNDCVVRFFGNCRKPIMKTKWVAKIREAGVRRLLDQQLDMLQPLRRQADRELFSGESQASDHRRAADYLGRLDRRWR